MSTPSLVFVHGWGFDAGFWHPVRALLPDRACAAIDLGFTGEASAPEPPAGAVAVGHSLGFLWLLERRPFPWRALIAINGFPRFVEGDGFRPAVAARALERMIAEFDRNPGKVAAEFLVRCGASAPADGFDARRMAEALRWLLEWDGRRALSAETAPVHVLAGRGDPIVPPAMTVAGFAGRQIHWHEGGHLLPQTDPAWCAERIVACLA